MAKSTIVIPYRGIIEFTGEHDTGKTIAMLQTVKDFSKTVFIDDDIKGDGTVKQMAEQGVSFEDYIDLAQERQKISRTPTADELLESIVFPLVDRVTAKHHDVIIFDTWRMIYQAARGHVERNQFKYKDVVKWQGSSTIIQGLISKVARMIEREALTRLKDACDLLLISHHIKANYKANVEIGVIPESSATFSEVCNMRIWLRRNNQSATPIMLFLKRPNIPTMTPKGLRPVNIVPLKITPTDKEQSIWEAIARYEKDPIGNRAPRIDETPTPEELATISGTLTPEQMAYVERMIEYNKQVEKEASEIFGGVETTSGSQSAAKMTIETPPNGSGSTQSTMPSGYPVNVIELLTMSKEQFGYNVVNIQDILKLSLAEINTAFKKEYWETLKDAAEADAKKDVKKKKK